MSDTSEHGEHPVEGDAKASIGRYLASQRRLRGISLDELAARTKIPRRNLERLEAGAFDGQGDGFVRGFVRTVAEALGLDPHEAVMRLVGEPQAGDEDWQLGRWGSSVALALLGLAVLAALGFGLRMAARWITEPSGGPPDVIYRRDAVRSLADQDAEPGASRSEADAAAGAGDDPARR